MNTSFPNISQETVITAVMQAQSYTTAVVLTVLIAVMGIWSTLGNMITIAAICRTNKLQTKSNMFIFSLAFSDLLSGLIASPLWLYRRVCTFAAWQYVTYAEVTNVSLSYVVATASYTFYGTWGFEYWALGNFMCTVFFTVDEFTSYCTCLHIAFFGVWRYAGIRWPRKIMFAKIRNVNHFLGLLWAISISFGVYFGTLFQIVPKNAVGLQHSNWPMCSVKVTNNGLQRFQRYYTLSSIGFYFTSMLILFVSSILIAVEILQNPKFKRNEGSTKEKKAVYQLSLISALFLVGYVPMCTFRMWTIYQKNKSKTADAWWPICAYISLRISECMNPIAYAVTSQNIRAAFWDIITKTLRLKNRNSGKTPNTSKAHASNMSTVM